MKKNLFVLGIIIFSLVAMLFVPAFTQDTANEQEKTSVYEVSALWQEITDESLSFEFDDPVTVTGFVIDKGISKYATPYVTLSDKTNGKEYAVCVLPRTDVTKLSDFSKGQKVTLSGNYYSMKERIVIKKCKQVK